MAWDPRKGAVAISRAERIEPGSLERGQQVELGPLPSRKRVQQYRGLEAGRVQRGGNRMLVGRWEGHRARGHTSGEEIQVGSSSREVGGAW